MFAGGWRQTKELSRGAATDVLAEIKLSFRSFLALIKESKSRQGLLVYAPNRSDAMTSVLEVIFCRHIR